MDSNTLEEQCLKMFRYLFIHHTTFPVKSSHTQKGLLFLSNGIQFTDHCSISLHVTFPAELSTLLMLCLYIICLLILLSAVEIALLDFIPL